MAPKSVNLSLKILRNRHRIRKVHSVADCRILSNQSKIFERGVFWTTRREFGRGQAGNAGSV